MVISGFTIPTISDSNRGFSSGKAAGEVRIEDGPLTIAKVREACKYAGDIGYVEAGEQAYEEFAQIACFEKDYPEALTVGGFYWFNKGHKVIVKRNNTPGPKGLMFHCKTQTVFITL